MLVVALAADLLLRGPLGARRVPLGAGEAELAEDDGDGTAITAHRPAHGTPAIRRGQRCGACYASALLIAPGYAALAMLAWIGVFFVAGAALLRARDVD